LFLSFPGILINLSKLWQKHTAIVKAARKRVSLRNLFSGETGQNYRQVENN
jgi:hypothetical protein